jgi:regulator of nucleoside diphosphate kinase
LIEAPIVSIMPVDIARSEIMRLRPIVLSEADAQRLRGLLAARAASSHDQEHLLELQAELERAVVRASSEVPADVVTMNAQVRVLDLATGERRQFMLVLPADADVTAQRISVLAPLGTAVLGYREGDEVEWVMPGGLRTLRIERVTQPDPADDASRGERPRARELITAAV